MPIEDFEGNVPPIGGGQGYRPPGLPPAYKPPEIVDPPSYPPSGNGNGNGNGDTKQTQMTPLPDNMLGFFMLILGL